MNASFLKTSYYTNKKGILYIDISSYIQYNEKIKNKNIFTQIFLFDINYLNYKR